MRYSIRHLLGLIVLAAMSIQGFQAFVRRGEVRRLEQWLDTAESAYRQRADAARPIQAENEVCREVLEHHQSPTASYLAAKRRFELLPPREADE